MVIVYLFKFIFCDDIVDFSSKYWKFLEVQRVLVKKYKVIGISSHVLISHFPNFEIVWSYFSST